MDASSLKDTDEALVQAALKDRQAFAPLVFRYESALDRYIWRLGVSVSEDRQDVLQDIFIKAYRNLASFDTSLKFSSWIYRIAHNEAVSWFRKRSVRPEGHLVSDSTDILNFVQSMELNPIEKYNSNETASSVRMALEQVPEKYRTVLLLRFMEQKDYEEISDILTIPVSTVGTLILRGKEKLREVLSATL